MDASELTRRRRARTLYTNNVYRQNAIASGVITNKPATSGNQIGDRNGVDYNEWKNYITIGPTTISRAELDVIFAEPPAPTPPLTFTETFAVFVKFDTLPNWVYRVYNATTNTWTGLIDTGYPHATWTEYDNANTKNYFCLVLNRTGTSALDFIFIDSNGLIVNTISMPDISVDYELTRNFLIINDDTTVQIYNPVTQILQQTLIPISSYETLENGVLLVGPTVEGNRSYYMWPLGSTAEPVFIVNHITGRGYSSERAINNDITVLITYSGVTYVDTVYLIFSNGTFTSYDLLEDTYNDVNIDFYGINNKFTLLKLVADNGNVTYHSFPNVLGTITPNIITLTNPTQYIEYYFSNNDPSPSFQSNHLVITNFAPNTNVSYILTGGDLFGTAYSGGPFENDISGGNYMKLSAGKVVFDPDERVKPDFIMDSAIYGTYKKYTDESGHIAGYVVGSNTAGNPHTSLVYTDNGIAQIGVSGAYAYGISGNTDRLQQTYNAGSGFVGTWWSLVRKCTGDGPTNCEVWFTIENVLSWSTDLDDFIDYRQVEGDNLYESSIDVSGSNFVLGKVMLAATINNDITNTQIVNYLQAYVADAIPHLFTNPDDFTTISGEMYKTWHDLSGAQYLSYITNSYVYTYDQGEPMPPPQFSEGTAYVSISGESFQIYEYTEPNLLSKHIAMNETAVMIIEGDRAADKQRSHLFTASDLSGTVVDLSGNMPTNPYSILTIVPIPIQNLYIQATQQNFIYYNIENIFLGDPNWFPVGSSYFVMDNNNVQLYHELYSPVIILSGFTDAVQSGNNYVTPGLSLLSIYGDIQVSYLLVVRNSVVTKYSDINVNNLFTNEYDNASGVIFGYTDNEDGTSNIVTITNSDISGSTFEISYLSYYRLQVQDHFIILGGPILVIRIWDSTGTDYIYTPSTPIDNVSVYLSYILNTSTKICFFLFNDTTELFFYVIFDLTTHTYTDTISQGIEGSVATSFINTVNYVYSTD